MMETGNPPTNATVDAEALRESLGLPADATDEEVTAALDAAQASVAAARASHAPTAAADTVAAPADPNAWPPPEHTEEAEDGTSVSDQWSQHRRRLDGSLVLVGPHQDPPADSDPTGNSAP